MATTQWSLVLAARDGAETEAHRALESLCRSYWMPLYAYARSLGNDRERAEDMTQGYFAYLLEKNLLQKVEPEAGRFRSFLLVSLKHFIAHEHRKEQALKRGGGTPTLAIDSSAAEDSLSAGPVSDLSPEQAFEYRWGLAVLDRALERLRAESSANGKEDLFDGLKPHLTGQEPRVPFREIGQALKMTETATRGAMYRLRQRYGQLIRAEIAETVADPQDVDSEVRHLLTVIKPWEVSQE